MDRAAGERPAFYWGAATAAYQIEGAVDEDGRGKSTWDVFSHTPGKTLNGDTGDIAADHYHRWQTDIDLMRELNLNAYRFSPSWSRIMPDGRGAVNQAGLDFYNRLVDGLLAAGIEPFVTLFHFDLPQALQDDGGGWLRRGIVDDFTAFADVMTRELGDRVRHWMTINEPWTHASLGYMTGEDAPGLQLGLPEGLTVAHHLLLAHGSAVEVVRSNLQEAEVGIVLDINHVEAASDAPEDVAAAERYEAIQNRWYLDALFLGRYPELVLELCENQAPDVRAGDLEQISAACDFIGVNLYRRSIIGAGKEMPPVNYRRVNPPGEYTAMGWEVWPQSLYDTLTALHRDYGPSSIYVTENGAAFPDVVGDDGQVHDERRVAYLRDYIKEALRARTEGVPLDGYFAWTLMDNFEWAYGYDRRFGLIYVDFETQERIIKDSGYVFAQIAADDTLLTRENCAS